MTNPQFTRGPNPMPDIMRAEPTRYWFCSHYNACLDLTIRKAWASFSCTKCLAYEEELPTYTEVALDYEQEDPTEEW
jgi:hypothetical protein